MAALPDRANAKLFGRMRAFGADLADEGRFDAERLREHAGLERFSPTRAALTDAMMRVPLAH